MTVSEDHSKRIEDKLLLVSSKIKGFKKENEKLKKELEVQMETAMHLKKKIEALEIKLSMQEAGESEESKSSKAKLEKKISTYIKEIDRCIALLGDQG
jgi:regulator of replication initiation timing